MASSITKDPAPLPRIDDVLADIAYFRRCMSKAGADPSERQALQAVYEPFLTRRLRLLEILKNASQERSNEKGTPRTPCAC